MYRFNGSTTRLLIIGDSEISFRSAAYSSGGSGIPITFSAWVRLNSKPPSGHDCMIHLGTTSPGSRILVVTPSSFAFGSVNGSSSVNIVTAATTANTGTWYHVLGTQISSSSRKIYMDGVEEAADTVSAEATTGYRVTLGARGQNPGVWGNYFDGYMCEPCIIRGSLTLEQIQYLAEGYSPFGLGKQIVMYVPLRPDYLYPFTNHLHDRLGSTFRNVAGSGRFDYSMTPPPKLKSMDNRFVVKKRPIFLFENTAIYKRGIRHFNGLLEEIPTASLGTGIKPIVLMSDGTLKQRETSEGSPIIRDGANLRTLAAGETLEV